MAMLLMSTAIQQEVGIEAKTWSKLEENLANFRQPYKMAANVCKQRQGPQARHSVHDVTGAHVAHVRSLQRLIET